MKKGGRTSFSEIVKQINSGLVPKDLPPEFYDWYVNRVERVQMKAMTATLEAQWLATLRTVETAGLPEACRIRATVEAACRPLRAAPRARLQGAVQKSPSTAGASEPAVTPVALCRLSPSMMPPCQQLCGACAQSLQLHLEGVCAWAYAERSRGFSRRESTRSAAGTPRRSKRSSGKGSSGAKSGARKDGRR